MKSEVRDDSDVDEVVGDLFDIAPPSSLFDDGPASIGDFGLEDVLVASPAATVSDIASYHGYEADSVQSTDGYRSEPVAAQQPEEGCVCAEVATADQAVDMFKAAAHDVVAFLSSVPGNVSVERRCEIVRRVRSLSAQLRCA